MRCTDAATVACVQNAVHVSGLSDNLAAARLFQIGQVADRVGLSLRTVRYYEEIGLVTPSSRTEGRFRLYSEEDVERLLLVKSMKPLGLTLKEMRELVDLVELSARPSALATDDLGALVTTLSDYAARTDDAIETLERRMTEARQLRLRIGERLGRCELTFEQTVASGR